MKRFMYVFAALALIVSASVLAGQKFAPSTDAANSGTPKSMYVEPCSYWKYDYEARAYVCQNVGFRTRMYEADEVDQLINQLASKINDLEHRVTALEGQP